MLTMNSFVAKLAAVDNPPAGRDEVRVAKRAYAAFREAKGYAKASPALLTPPRNNYKLAKGDVSNYGLSLAPARVSGVVNLCHMSTPGCRDLCINTAGNGQYPIVQQSRILRTEFAVADPEAFLTLLKFEVAKAVTDTKAEKKELAIRLNVFSDILWENAAPWLFSEFDKVQFYDYTKDHTRFESLPDNYHLTFSASERTGDVQLMEMLEDGINVTIVADKLNGEVPDTWNDFEVLDGDITDYRPSDPDGVVVFLKPKGKARNKTAAPRGRFVRSPEGFAMKEEEDGTRLQQVDAR